MHLQLDEHLTSESVLHRAHTCIHTNRGKKTTQILSTETQLHTARCLSPHVRAASCETACVRLCACMRVRLPDDMHTLSALNLETGIDFMSDFLAHSPSCVLYLFPPFFCILACLLSCFISFFKIVVPCFSS